MSDEIVSGVQPPGIATSATVKSKLPPPVFRKARPRALARHRAEIEMPESATNCACIRVRHDPLGKPVFSFAGHALSFDRLKSGARNVKGHFTRVTLAILFCLPLTLNASAETVAETARRWGLIGPWSQDCSLPPDRDKGAVLAYEVESGDRVVHRRNFGDTTDQSEVISAKVSGNGMLNLRVLFPQFNQTREYGFIMQPDGTMRAIYNRDQKKRYTIKDGKFTADGIQTPPQHKCKE
jgi:hypothetical protein